MTKDELIARQREINNQIGDYQGRELTADEKVSFKTLVDEFNNNKREIANIAEAEAADASKTQKKMENTFREFLMSAKEGGKKDIALRGASSGINLNYISANTEHNNIAAAGAIPNSLQELLPLLQNALVYDKLGIRVATGVTGNIIWPALSAGCTATVGGEEASVSDSKIDFAKVQAVPKRIAVRTKVSYEALDNAAFDVEAVVRQNFTDCLAQVLNDGVLYQGSSPKFDSPLIHGNAETLTFAGSTPTYAELLEMRSKVAENNVAMKAPAYVMDNAMYAKLQATPMVSGDSRMIIEDGKIGGYPVIVTEAASKIGFGDWSYVAMNQHGESRLIVDPYSAAATGEIALTLGCDWSITTLRGEAFCLGSL